MATPRDIRRLAFQGLFQLDADGDAESVRASLESSASQGKMPKSTGEHEDAIEKAHTLRGVFTERELDKVMDLAMSAYRGRREADRTVDELSPGWPAHRRPAVDRAILRLAYFEMTSGCTPPKVAVNEAVELAKQFSTEKSPGFVNAVLDRVLKRVLGQESSADASQMATTEMDTEPSERDPLPEPHVDTEPRQEV